MKVSRNTVVLGALVGLVIGAVGFVAWKQSGRTALPPGIVATNGRVEANQVDIATKLAGRIVDVIPREGDMVEAGAAVARLDKDQQEAQLRQGEAEAQRARQAQLAAEAVAASRRAELTFADQEVKRSAALVDRGYTPREKMDQRQQQLASAEAALNAAIAQVDQAKAAIKAADAQVEQIKTVLADATVRSPVRGRVQYRLIEPGAVLAAGGRILSVLDLSDVHMTIFLPAGEAGRLTVGDEARVVLDAYPQYVFPATVSFIAGEAQFTPKTVETREEREKLMFRIKLQAQREMVKEIEERVKTGLRGIAYVRTDRVAIWPIKLAPKLPQ
jgi:HlyD family secretion protein